jgi:hypothetical protein
MNIVNCGHADLNKSTTKACRTYTNSWKIKFFFSAPTIQGITIFFSHCNPSSQWHGCWMGRCACVRLGGVCVCVSICFLFNFFSSLFKYISMYVPISFYLSTSLFYIFSLHITNLLKLSLVTNNYTHDWKTMQCFFLYYFIKQHMHTNFVVTLCKPIV